MHVRSRGLFALSLAMLALAGALGAIAVHDLEAGATEPSQAELGDPIVVKGDLQPTVAAYHPKVSSTLDIFTAVLADDELEILVTSSAPLPTGTYIVEGLVVHAPGDLVDGVLVIDVEELRQPLVWK